MSGEPDRAWWKEEDRDTWQTQKGTSAGIKSPVSILRTPDCFLICFPPPAWHDYVKLFAEKCTELAGIWLGNFLLIPSRVQLESGPYPTVILLWDQHKLKHWLFHINTFFFILTEKHRMWDIISVSISCYTCVKDNLHLSSFWIIHPRVRPLTSQCVTSLGQRTPTRLDDICMMHFHEALVHLLCASPHQSPPSLPLPAEPLGCEQEVHHPLAINSSPHNPPLSSLTSPGKPLEPRLPPPLDKWAVEEGSYTCGGVETITHRGNGVGDEEEWKEGTDSSCFHRCKRRLVIGLWKKKKNQGAEELELFQPTSIWMKRIIWPQN